MSEAMTPKNTRPAAQCWRLVAVVLFVACVALSGCAPKKSERGSAPIEGYNHTSAAINWFTVDGNGGSNFGPYLGGNSQTCCIALPRKWRPGLTVLVEWEKDPSPHDYATITERRFSDAWTKRMEEFELKNTRHSATVEVAPYEELGLLNVHFLPCDQVKVSASLTYLGMPNHPYNYPSKMEVPAVCPTP
jgi:hypothetical protein